jgi:ribosomal protein L11 methyltransferase
MKSKRIYLWRKFVAPRRIDIYQTNLRDWVGDEFAIITRPNHKRALFEVACKSQKQARELITEFGGRIQKLSAGWQRRLTRDRKARPLKIGKRLAIVRSSRDREANSFPYKLVIPAGAAFGTGEHMTTAMSLRLLEQITRSWKPGWSMVDLGTGSGILALAAKCFGARRVLAIDNDLIAISTAKTNARLNKIDNINFKIGDALCMKDRHEKFDLIAANLFSELLIEILPELRRSRWLILSGVLRKQEDELLRALRRNKIDILQVRRRGKWIAIATTLS